MRVMQREIEKAIRAADETVKYTDLSYPNRASIRGFLGAALIMNVAPAKVPPHHIYKELRAHLLDALKPLGLAVKRQPVKKPRPIHRGT
jgi:hypothetical protein